MFKIGDRVNGFGDKGIIIDKKESKYGGYQFKVKLNGIKVIAWWHYTNLRLIEASSCKCIGAVLCKECLKNPRESIRF